MATKMTREEAIKIVQSATVWTDEERDALAMLIPELAESEDERIRKWLVNYFSTIKEMIWIHRDITCEQILDWLEKQKECVSNNFDDVWDEEDCEEIIAEGQKLTPRFKELLKEVCHAWYDRGAKLEKQKEQKPAEWSEEDEKDMAHIIRILDDCYVYGTHDLSKTDHENLVNKLKSLRPSWKPNEKHLSALLAVFNDPNNIGSQTCQLALTDLYEQLKKL